VKVGLVDTAAVNEGAGVNEAVGDRVADAALVGITVDLTGGGVSVAVGCVAEGVTVWVE
jgi:hypothetical protein